MGGCMTDTHSLASEISVHPAEPRALVSRGAPGAHHHDESEPTGGKPNLSAPAPRTADGKPDLSGLWENAPIRGGGRRGAPPPPPAPGEPPLATFFNVGAGFPEGLPFRPWAKELLEKRRADND